jgi:nickel/cobalt exporter
VRCLRLGLLALLLAGMLALPALAQNPLPGRQAPAAGEAPAVAPGFFAPIGRALLAFQREANREIGRQMRAIRDGRTTAPLLMGLVLAFVYGAIHAAGPGHGKLVVMTYFLSREARVGRGLLMGVQIALMHVISAIVVVLFADFLLRRALGGAPAEIPAVRLVSYGLILAIGLVMLARAARRAFLESGHGHAHAHDEPGHGEPVPGCGCGARHGESGLLSLGVGLVPCTGSMLILLYAMANGILPAGLLLVVMIALGMAVTMGALGFASVLARRFVAERVGAGQGRGALVLDMLGAGAITVLGALLLATAP